jgi:proteasome lid subunit RPN8/RPN11
MNITLRLTTSLHDELLAMAMAPVETGAVLIAHLVPVGSDQMLLLGTDLVHVPEDAYEVRTDRALQITSNGYVHALKTARSQGAVAIWVHSHPGDRAVPRPSRHDARVNDQLEALFSERTGSDQYGYLIVSHQSGALAYTGAIVGQVDSPISGSAWLASVGYSERTTTVPPPAIEACSTETSELSAMEFSPPSAE